MKLKPVITLFLLLALAVKLHAQCATTISSYPFTEDFESSNGGWTDGGTSSDWAWGTPAKTVISGAASGNKCWITGGLNNSAYNNGENSYLTSPCFDFSALVNPKLSVSVFWETEKRFDGANLQYSTDGGAVWQILGAVGGSSCTSSNWYNNGAITYLGDAGWSGNIQSTSGSCQGGSGSGVWLAATQDLSFLAGQSKVIFRFHFGAGTTCNNFDGFAMDMFSIAEAPTGPADFTYTCGVSKTVSFMSSVSGCPSSYAWDFGDPGSGSNNMSSSANPLHQFSGTGLFTVNLIVSYPSAPQSTVTHQVEIIDANIVTNNTILCHGNTTGSLTAVATGSAGPYIYVWNTSPVQYSATISGLAAGTYTVTVSTATSCPVTNTVTLTEPGSLQVTPTVTDALCGKANGAINAVVTGGTSPYQYSWSTGSSASAINNLSPATYSVQLTDKNSCTASANNIVVANKNKNVPVSLGSNLYVCPGQTLILNPGHFSSYRWQDNSTNPTYTVTGAGLYSVQVTDADGCTGNASAQVTEDCGDIYFPAAFTPNGDTKNDLFGAFGNIAAIQHYSLKVFDRWGELIFVSSDPATRWDGTLKGKKFNSGSFVWFATYIRSGRFNQEQHGTVTLIR
jgi:gliding motility-associated-like protein